jgi:dolichol-phosphate mannosyltransferase
MPSSPDIHWQEIKKVSVVLPTYNEAGNIVELIHALHGAIRQPNEIIVVDDNSPDGTSALVREMISRNVVPGLRLETRLTDRGLTKSIRRGIELAEGDTVVWMDCDFSMPPEKIPLLLSKIEEGFDIAVGSRFVSGGKYKESANWVGGEESKLAIMLSRFLNWMVRTSLYPGFHDYTSGFIAVRKTVLDRIPLRGFYGEYFLDFIYRALLLDYKVTEIPYVCMPRKAGESKTGASLRHLVRYGKLYLRTLVRMWGLRIRKVTTGSIGM